MVPLNLELRFKSRQGATLLEVCCLTFELRGRSRDGAWPARPMMRTTASRAKCHAGGGPRSSEGLGFTVERTASRMPPQRLQMLDRCAGGAPTG